MLIDGISILLLKLADSATELASCQSYIANAGDDNFPHKDHLFPKSNTLPVKK